ncbi:hypothetical protein FRACA_540014 [Frankia canadensis]|uniref:Uncharacterized protein n=1 Tax=Frankia canadensis TaxID=1836972 RepID=A0A2I2KYU5_9ACTN|nr:hypothetical protein FRACA_540014 [Frankia canadensis]SOU58118.1 hypothetical protein FRACA_540014 [Frankia canadensis]
MKSAQRAHRPLRSGHSWPSTLRLSELRRTPGTATFTHQSALPGYLRHTLLLWQFPVGVSRLRSPSRQCPDKRRRGGTAGSHSLVPRRKVPDAIDTPNSMASRREICLCCGVARDAIVAACPPSGTNAADLSGLVQAARDGELLGGFATGLQCERARGVMTFG